jgi:hypothetical protein
MFLSVRLLALAALGLLSTAHAAPFTEPYPNTSNFGVPFSKDESWYQQCMRAEKRVAPRTGDAHAAPVQCDADTLYYTKLHQAQTSPAEWNAVRACATASADNAVLMMLYANGLGVQRDAGIATHYACAMDHVAKAEMEGRIAHLAAPPASAPFDQCDDITSGYMGAICAEIREDQDLRVRTARLDRIARTLAPPSRDAFATLRAAAERYAMAATDETDMQGTAAAGISLQHRARLREQFMQAALDATAGKLPPASPDDFAREDGKLNALYQTVMAIPSTQDGSPDRIGQSTITRAAVRGAERLWLVYRDAFAGFAATLPAGPDAVAVKTLLTGQRIAQLADIERSR